MGSPEPERNTLTSHTRTSDPNPRRSPYMRCRNPDTTASVTIITAMPNAVETVAMRIMIRAREARPLRAVRSANMYSKLMGRHISL